MRRDTKRQKWITLRREILADVVRSDPDRTWSVRELLAEMLKNETVQRTQPDLGKSTVNRDWLAIKGSIQEKIKELADDYTSNQLEQLQDLNDELEDRLQSLKEITFDDIEDPGEAITLRLKVANQIKALSDSILKIQKRQSAIVPNQAPKLLEVKEERHYTLDMFHSARTELIESGAQPLSLADSIVKPNTINPLLVANNDDSENNIIDGEVEE